MGLERENEFQPCAITAIHLTLKRVRRYRKYHGRDHVKNAIMRSIFDSLSNYENVHKIKLSKLGTHTKRSISKRIAGGILFVFERYKESNDLV